MKKLIIILLVLVVFISLAYARTRLPIVMQLRTGNGIPPVVTMDYVVFTADNVTFGTDKIYF